MGHRPLPAKIAFKQFLIPKEKRRRDNLKKKSKEEIVKLTIRIPKSKKEMMTKIFEKSSYNSLADLTRAGIDKEINLQIYKDNMDVIVKELSKLIDIKLDSFFNSQRKLNANNVRINALNTYIMGEVMRRIMGDDLHEEFMKIIESGRVKANYYVSRKTEDMPKEELLDFYGIGKIYRNE